MAMHGEAPDDVSTVPVESPRPWTAKETAEYYRVTERTVRAWIAKGAIDVVRVGRTVRIVPPPEAQSR